MRTLFRSLPSRRAVMAMPVAVCLVFIAAARGENPTANASTGEVFAGSYRNQNLGIVLAPVAGHPGDFTGVIRKGTKEFPLSATRTPQGLTGRFQSDGQSFDFTASLQNGGLRLVTDNTTYILGEAGVPDGYQTLARGDAGRALIVTRDAATSARALILGTLDDLAAGFDAKPEMSDGLIANDDRTGAVSFTAMLLGRKVSGMAIVSAGPRGGIAIVAYSSADAAGHELPQLLGQVRAMFTPMPQVAFTDGSGSIQLPAGWKIVQVHNGCPAVAGPQGQLVALGQHQSLATPEAERAFERRQAALGLPARPSGLPVAAFADPVETMRTLWTKYGDTFNPPIHLVEMAHSEAQTPSTAGTKQAFLQFTCDLGTPPKSQRYAGEAIAICTPPGADGSWKCDYSALLAPEAIYERDLPLMTAIWNSWHINAGAVLAHAQARAAADLSGAARSLEKSALNKWSGEQRQFADWDDVISGCGMAQNVGTGQLKYLGTQTVNQLNQQGTARYTKFPQ